MRIFKLDAKPESLQIDPTTMQAFQLNPVHFRFKSPFVLILAALILAAGLVVSAYLLAGWAERANESAYKINKQIMSEQLEKLHRHQGEPERG